MSKKNLGLALTIITKKNLGLALTIIT